MKKVYRYDVFETAIGPLTAAVDQDGAVTHLYTSDTGDSFGALGFVRDSDAVAPVRSQLEEYACGKRREFDLPLAPEGTPFQHRVWELLKQIPYGETRSYGDLAEALGSPKASRAVGRANGTNPISIIVPCHRVIGSTGTLTGYGGGLPMKQKLLELEGALEPALFVV